MLSSNIAEGCVTSTRSIEGRDLYLTKIISDIGELVTSASSTATESAAIIMKFLCHKFTSFTLLVMSGITHYKK